LSAEAVDGGQVSDLAGYRIYYRLSSASLTQTLDIKGATTTSAVVGNLPQGMWYFNITAYTSSNRESAASNMVSKTVL